MAGATPSALGVFDGVWDRGGVSAVPSSTVPDYVAALSALTSVSAPILVEVTDVVSLSGSLQLPRHNSKQLIVDAFQKGGHSCEVLHG